MFVDIILLFTIGSSLMYDQLFISIVLTVLIITITGIIVLIVALDAENMVIV